jgi:hypothetical protein
VLSEKQIKIESEIEGLPIVRPEVLPMGKDPPKESFGPSGRIP